MVEASIHHSKSNLPEMRFLVASTNGQMSQLLFEQTQIQTRPALIIVDYWRSRFCLSPKAGIHSAEDIASLIDGYYHDRLTMQSLAEVANVTI